MYITTEWLYGDTVSYRRIVPVLYCEKSSNSHISYWTIPLKLTVTPLSELVCLCVIYVCVRAGVSPLPTSGTAVIGVVSPQALSRVIDDTYHNLSARVQPTNRRPALPYRHPPVLTAERHGEMASVPVYEFKDATWRGATT